MGRSQRLHRARAARASEPRPGGLHPPRARALAAGPGRLRPADSGSLGSSEPALRRREEAILAHPPATADEAPLLRELDDEGVLLLTLNRPKRKNAFDDAQWDALGGALAEADADPRVAVVVLTGAGGDFSAGVDLASFQGGPPAPRADGHASAFHACEAALLAFEKPLLVAATGVAVGGGCTIALAADVTYAGEGLRARLPFANLGLVPEFASSYTLQASIGRQHASDLMLTADWIDAARALELGLVARVLPDAELVAATVDRARDMARWPTSALVAIKRTLRTAHAAGIAAALEAEHREMERLAGSPENVEAVTAFLQKREPDFRRFRRQEE